MNPEELSLEMNVIIVPEVLRPLVDKYFDQMSQAQWSMLAAGIKDISTKTIIAEMCVDIAQTLVRAFLSILIPAVVQQLMTDTAMKIGNQPRVEIRLGESMNQMFAEALGISHRPCESATKLSALMEQEVMTRVNLTLRTLVNAASMPEDPALYVHGTMSDFDSLGKIVFYAHHCLGRYLNGTKRRCFGPCWRPKQKEPLSLTLCTDGMKEVDVSSSLLSTIEAVAEILLKWCPDKDATEMVTKAHEVADEIISVVIQELHHPDDAEDVSCKDSAFGLPHCNFNPILEKVRTFFASCCKVPVSHQNTSSRPFCDFARVHFEKMMEQLRRLFEQGESHLLVNLQQLAEAPQLKPFDSWEFLPVVSQTPRSDGGWSSSRSTVFTDAAAFGFDFFRNDVLELFSHLQQPAGSTGTSHMMSFSRKLTGKIFGHLTPSDTDQMPSVPEDRYLSDCVIPGSVSDGSKTSPEVLYAMAESAVRRFVQLVQFWLQTNNTSDSDVSGAVNDISKLIAARQTLVEPCSRRQTPEESVASADVAAEMRHLDSAKLNRRRLCRHQSSDVHRSVEETKGFYPYLPVSANSDSADGLLSVVSNRNQSTDVEELSYQLGAKVIMRLVAGLPRNTRKALRREKLLPVVTRMSDMVGDMDPSLVLATKDKYVSQRVVKAVVEDIIREFDCPEQAMGAAFQTTPFFEEMVHNRLVAHLSPAEDKKPHKKCKIHRFFSKLFTCAHLRSKE